MTAHLALDFALAVSAREEELRVGDANNRYAGRRWPAVLPTDPYAVYLAGPDGYRTLALDLDAPAAQAERQAAVLSAVLKSAGIDHIQTLSGTPGRRHLIATFTEPVAPDLVLAVGRTLRDNYAPGLDIALLGNAATGCVRPPLSPHRQGGRSEPVGSTRAALRVLQLGNPASRLRELASQHRDAICGGTSLRPVVTRRCRSVARSPKCCATVAETMRTAPPRPRP